MSLLKWLLLLFVSILAIFAFLTSFLLAFWTQEKQSANIETSTESLTESLPDEGCDSPFVGDGLCDLKYKTVECLYDNGDCCTENGTFFIASHAEYEGDRCIEIMELGSDEPVVGDGNCDFYLNTAEYDYDGGDCDKTTTSSASTLGCLTNWIGDGWCDFYNYNLHCDWDGGDCSDGMVFGNWTTTTSTTQEPELCVWAMWAGDGICDDDNNFKACNFDDGDCCLDPINDIYCSQCLCKNEANVDYPIITTTLEPCPSPEKINNGICDEENRYVFLCSNDGTDCVCLDYDFQDLALHGDGFCDTYLNTPLCDFDGGDCCGDSVDLTFCNPCICFEDLFNSLQ